MALLAGAALVLAAAAPAEVVLKNDRVSFTFAETPRVALLAASAAAGGGSPLARGGFAELWELQLLTPAGLELCGPTNATHSSATLSGDAVTLTWSVRCVAETYVVTQRWSLPAAADAAAVSLTVQPASSTTQSGSGTPKSALWAVSASVGSILGGGEAFYPSGYGETLAAGYKQAGSAGGAGTYPGSGCTMQFMAARGKGDSPAMYFAAHDPAAHQKWLLAYEHDGREPQPVMAQGADPSRPLLREAGTEDGKSGPDCTAPVAKDAYPLGARGAGANAAGTQSLTITTLLEGAGNVRTGPYTLPFELAVAPLPPSSATEAPMWYSAAQVYRRWALSSAEWTRKGPIAQRQADFPQWYLDLNVWVNSGWQCYDRFNDTQGDPPTVLQNAMAISQRFNLSTGIGLHWYEWQCGKESRYRCHLELHSSLDGSDFVFDRFRRPVYREPRRASLQIRHGVSYVTSDPVCHTERLELT